VQRGQQRAGEMLGHSPLQLCVQLRRAEAQLAQLGAQGDPHIDTGTCCVLRKGGCAGCVGSGANVRGWGLEESVLLSGVINRRSGV